MTNSCVQRVSPLLMSHFGSTGAVFWTMLTDPINCIVLLRETRLNIRVNSADPLPSDMLPLCRVQAEIDERLYQGNLQC